MKFMPTKFELKITLDFEDMINDVIISENYKMAPRWRHGWLMTIILLYYKLQEMIDDHGKVHVDWWCQFWDMLWTKYGSKKEE